MNNVKREEIRTKIFSTIDELPTLPTVVPRLMELLEGTKSNASDVTEAISRDPALTSKILKVANSAYYGFPQEITDLERAVALLGFNMVKSLAMSVGVFQTLPSGQKMPYFSLEGLWIHSLSVATAIKEMTRRQGKEDEKSYLFIVGLLHDIGKVVLDQFFNDSFQKALAVAKDLEKPRLYLAERQVIGLDHGEVGGMLLERWNFPRVIIDPVTVHHLTGFPADMDEYDVAMLKVADALPQELGLGDQGNPVLSDLCNEDLAVLGTDITELDDIKDHLHKSRDAIFAFLGALSG